MLLLMYTICSKETMCSKPKNNGISNSYSVAFNVQVCTTSIHFHKYGPVRVRILERDIVMKYSNGCNIISNVNLILDA